MPKKNSEYGVPDAENPEWTPEMFKRSKRLSEMPEEFQRKMRAAFHGGRGPQKAPTKVQVTMRISPDVMAAVRETGPGWQVRVDEALRKEFVR